MDNESARLKYLFEKYFEKTASQDENAELAELINNEANRDVVMQLFADAWNEYQGDGDVVPPRKADEMLQNILAKNSWEGDAVVSINLKRRIIWRRIAAAAAIVIFTAGGVYWLSSGNNKSPEQTAVTSAPAGDVNPGTFKARLTLADGKSIVLDSAALGELTKQGNTLVLNKDGQLVYEAHSGGTSVMYNTLTTNKGEAYSFTLADGSKIWLNSASSVYFPVSTLR